MIHYSKKIFSVALLFAISLLTNISLAAESQNYQLIDGVAIYLGIVPAEIIQGHPQEHPESKMHGGTPSGSNQVHLMVALFDKTTGNRITDAEVMGTVEEVGLAGETKKLESMNIANTITYGNYFSMKSGNEYLILLQINRPGVPVVKAKFTHEHYPK